MRALEAEFLPIEVRHLETLRTLPFRNNHADPFDRLRIAQALQDRLVLVGSDTEFPSYPIQVLWN